MKFSEFKKLTKAEMIAYLEANNGDDILSRQIFEPEECDCGFPIDPTNAVHPPGSECICDLKD